MTSLQQLPYEVLVNLLRYLSVNDLQAASCVCRVWREVAGELLASRVTVMITDDAAPAIKVFKAATIPYQNWVFKGCDVRCDGELGGLWRQVAGEVLSLGVVQEADLTPRDLVTLLQPCFNLHSLHLDSLPHLLMPGTLLSDPEDRAVLSKSLANVKHLHLACSRYLTDALFSHLVSVVGPLTRLSLAGCQISFQRSLHKRFYPHDIEHSQPSEHILTFTQILKYIEANAGTLEELSFGRTYIDSESLHCLATVPGLKLRSLHVMSCEQLSKSGVQLLCENQPTLTHLDLSLCSRLTDYAVMAVAYHLPHLKSLNLRRCRGITQYGIRSLALLRNLEELNLSLLENVTSASVMVALGSTTDDKDDGAAGGDGGDGDMKLDQINAEDAFGGRDGEKRVGGDGDKDGDSTGGDKSLSGSGDVVRPKLRVLNLASLPMDWRSVARIPTLAPNLIHLDLSLCIAGVNDKSIQAVCKSLSRLRTLNLNGCIGLSDIGLAGHGLGQREPLINGTQLSLETLGIRDKNPLKVSLGSRAEQVIRQEAEVKQYLQNNMDQVVQSSEYGLSNLPGLRELNLCGCRRITDITLTYSFSLPELQYLNLSYCQVGEEGLESVARWCHSLEQLMLVECGSITDHVILVFSHYLKRIKTLDLQKCVRLTDDSLNTLSGCRTLRYLDVSGCRQMTVGAVQRVQERLPLLLNFHYRGIQESAGGEGEGERNNSFPVAARRIPPPPPLFSKLLRRKGGRR